MSIFKILAPSSHALQSSQVRELPSSGPVANPQLFPQGNSGRKRKRGRSTVESFPSTTAVPADLDILGTQSQYTNQDENHGPGLLSNDHEDKHENSKGHLAPDHELNETENESYLEDECKKILRSHKLKIAVLQDFTPQVSQVPVKGTDSKKSKKKREKLKEKEKEKEKEKKDTKRQLFPQPLTAFTQLRTRYGISRRLAENIAQQGYKLPTEVQLGALPLLLPHKGHEVSNEKLAQDKISGTQYDGRINLLTIAPTGSGKTIAFLIPIINHLLADHKQQDSQSGPRAIVLAPTRELASQIVNEARKLTKGTAIKASLMRKGMEVVQRSDEDTDEHLSDASADEDDVSDLNDHIQEVPQNKPLRRKAELVKANILVTTPLALLNALKGQSGAITDLPSVANLVLDEADVLLDPLFREQTLAIWNACTNPDLCVGLWSATMGSNIESLAVSALDEHWLSVTASSTTEMPPRPPLIRLVVGLKDSAVPNISHQLTYAATESGKLIGMRQLLHPTALNTGSSDHPTLQPPFLVFTQTISRAKALYSELLYEIPPEAGGSSRIAVLHADLSSSARDGIMTRFRRGEVWVLITTDLLARGIDFKGLNGVVNYDVPNSAAAYVHRVGRTGRAGRGGGAAVTFYTQEDIPYVKLIANVIRASEKLRGIEAEDGSVKQWLLDALPTPSKRDRQQLKQRGVEARRTVKNEQGKPKSRISTKSGYVRKMENNRRGAKMASKRRGLEDDSLLGSGVENTIDDEIEE